MSFNGFKTGDTCPAAVDLLKPHIQIWNTTGQFLSMSSGLQQLDYKIQSVIADVSVVLGGVHYMQLTPSS